jgi:hypothetical protein
MWGLLQMGAKLMKIFKLKKKVLQKKVEHQITPVYNFAEFRTHFSSNRN